MEAGVAYIPCHIESLKCAMICRFADDMGRDALSFPLQNARLGKADPWNGLRTESARANVHHVLQAVTVVKTLLAPRLRL